MKLQMKREALEKINRQANEMLLNPSLDSGTRMVQWNLFGTVEKQIGQLERAAGAGGACIN